MNTVNLRKQVHTLLDLMVHWGRKRDAQRLWLTAIENLHAESNTAARAAESRVRSILNNQPWDCDLNVPRAWAQPLAKRWYLV